MNSPPTPGSDLESASSRVGAPPKIRKFRLTVAVLWTLVILTLCWLPRDIVHEVENDSSWFEIPNLDKAVHGGIFLLLSLLWLRVGSSRWRFLWVALAGFVLAVVTEAGQSLALIGRDASVADGVTDCLGTLVGLALATPLEPMFLWVESRIFRKSSP